MSVLSWPPIKSEDHMDVPRDDSYAMGAPRNLGRDFNPHKFDFGMVNPIRDFNPLKFDFGVVGPQEHEKDLLDMLPECLGPETQLFLPHMGITSHQDVTLNGHDNVNESGYFQQSPVTPLLDTDTLNLLDTLELKFAPSSAVKPSSNEPSTTVDMSQVVVDVLNQPPTRPHLPEMNFEDKTNVIDVGDTQGLTPEQIRVLRNKAVQKRYRIRKKNESLRQNHSFANTKQRLAVIESKAPQHHIQVVDKVLRLRKDNKLRDAEIKRLRKLLATEKTSKEISESEFMVMDSGSAKDGDYCDGRIEVYLPREVVLDTFAEACCEKMMGELESSTMVMKALATSRHTMSSISER